MSVVQEIKEAENECENLLGRYSGKLESTSRRYYGIYRNMKHMRNRSTEDYISMLESQYAGFAVVETSKDDSTKLASLTIAMQELAEYEPLIISISMTTERQTTSG